MITDRHTFKPGDFESLAICDCAGSSTADNWFSNVELDLLFAENIHPEAINLPCRYKG